MYTLVKFVIKFKTPTALEPENDDQLESELERIEESCIDDVETLVKKWREEFPDMKIGWDELVEDTPVAGDE